MPKAQVEVKGLGMTAEVQELERMRKERPAHWAASLKSCNDALLCAYMRMFSIEAPQRRGRVSKTERIDCITEWNAGGGKEKKEEEEEGESTSDSDSDSEGDSSDSDSDSDSDKSELVSESDSSSESEPETPKLKKKKHVKQKPMPKAKPVEKKKDKEKREEKKEKEKTKERVSRKPQEVVVVVKQERPKRRSNKPKPKVKAKSGHGTDEDQDGKEGSEATYVESKDQPGPQSEIAILVGEMQTGNNSRLVRSKLKDARIKQQVGEWVKKQEKNGSLSAQEAHGLREDFNL